MTNLEVPVNRWETGRDKRSNMGRCQVETIVSWLPQEHMLKGGVPWGYDREMLAKAAYSSGRREALMNSQGQVIESLSITPIYGIKLY